MKVFIDSANLQDIDSALRSGFPRGITTNPSLLAKEPRGSYMEHLKKIVSLVREHGYNDKDFSLSVEVFTEDPDEMLKQARAFVKELAYPGLAIKLQAGLDSLRVTRELKKDGIAVNSTCNMTINQGVMAAAAGARYVSLFWGRIRDSGLEKHAAERDAHIAKGTIDKQDLDEGYVVRSTRSLLDQYYPGVEIIAGSMRTAADIKNAALAGAHIVTVPPKFFPEMASHYKTTEVIAQFLNDFKAWLS